MKKKITRKGSGRKKGQVSKIQAGKSPEEYIQIAMQGNFRKCVSRSYRALEFLAIKSSGATSARDIYKATCDVVNNMRRSPEVFGLLFSIINANHRGDAEFFRELAKALDAKPQKGILNDFFEPFAAELELFWFARLAQFYKTAGNSFGEIPPWFGNKVGSVLILPLDMRPPLTADAIGEFLELRIGYRPSASSISAKAKLVGIPLNKRFGKKA